MQNLNVEFSWPQSKMYISCTYLVRKIVHTSKIKMQLLLQAVHHHQPAVFNLHVVILYLYRRKPLQPLLGASLTSDVMICSFKHFTGLGVNHKHMLYNHLYSYCSGLMLSPVCHRSVKRGGWSMYFILVCSWFFTCVSCTVWPGSPVQQPKDECEGLWRKQPGEWRRMGRQVSISD